MRIVGKQGATKCQNVELGEWNMRKQTLSPKNLQLCHTHRYIVNIQSTLPMKYFGAPCISVLVFLLEHFDLFDFITFFYDFTISVYLGKKIVEKVNIVDICCSLTDVGESYYFNFTFFRKWTVSRTKCHLWHTIAQNEKGYSNGFYDNYIFGYRSKVI